MTKKGRTYRSLFFILTIIFILGNYTMLDAQQTRSRRGKQPQPTPTPKPVAPPEINYTVSMSKPWTHLLEVEMRVKPSQNVGLMQLVMPVWTPGSYLIREYARHVQDFAARDLSGNALTWEKINKNTWEITTKGVSEFVVTYNVYANELTVRTNELNDEHAFWNNTALLMHPKEWISAPSVLRVIPYGNWRVATGLPKVEGQENTFRAENFDILYDSPFEVADFKETTFNVRGIPHRITVTGEGNYDLQKMARDFAKIVEEGARIFGDLPYKDYLFIVNLRGSGGLEHLNSTALQFNRFAFTTRYTDFLNLVAHEHFHVWNVKRIRPDALGPFDYSNENYTKLLWVAEGATAYYESVLLRRAGLISDRDFLTTRASGIQALQNSPGRFQTSLEEASFDAWIKYYRRDENAINNQISYYDKGEIVNFLLDVEIRTGSNGAKSLDDVMRYLYEEFYKKNKNYTPGDYQKAAEMMAGKSLEDFFRKYVRGRDEIDYNAILNPIGLQLITGGTGRQAAYLGANLSQAGDRLTITSLPSDTPAYQQGLNANDQILAIDGHRASQQFLQSYLSEKRPGDKIRLTVFRFDQLREFEITLGGRAPQNYRIVPAENPTEAQRKLYRDYLGEELR